MRYLNDISPLVKTSYLVIQNAFLDTFFASEISPDFIRTIE